jgi:hypothetical protein
MSKFRTLMCAAALAIAAAPATSHAASTGGVATPYLGWSSWSTFRCDISDPLIRAQALAMHQQLQGHGYRYVNIDSDCANFIDGNGRKIYNRRRSPTAWRLSRPTCTVSV